MIQNINFNQNLGLRTLVQNGGLPCNNGQLNEEVQKFESQPVPKVNKLFSFTKKLLKKIKKAAKKKKKKKRTQKKEAGGAGGERSKRRTVKEEKH